MAHTASACRSQAVLTDQKPQRYRVERNELIKRLLADECELCGSTEEAKSTMSALSAT